MSENRSPSRNCGLSDRQIESALSRLLNGEPNTHEQTKAIVELALRSLRSETERSPESYEGQIKAQHQVIAELQAKAKRWQEIADQRAIEVADLKIKRGELALKLAGAECFIEEQRKKGNIK